MLKLGVFDLDGTIIQGEFLPESAVDAINRFRSKGNKAVFLTGRPFSHIDKRILDIGFDACICTMGAFVSIEGKVIRNTKPSSDIVRYVVRVISEFGFDATYESDEGIVFNFKKGIPDSLNGMKNHFLKIGLSVRENVEGCDFSFDKLCIWKNEDQSFEEIEGVLDEYLECSGNKGNMEEWIIKGISPVETIELLKDYYHVATENCYGIGDSISDWRFLCNLGHTAAMGQGNDELKRVAEYVTETIENNGFANALRYFELI